MNADEAYWERVEAFNRHIQNRNQKMKTVLSPLGNRVVIKLLEVATAESTLIVIPAHCKEKSMEGEVVAVGPGKLVSEKIIKGEPHLSYHKPVRLPMEVKAGDRVLVSKFAGSEFKIDGEDFRVVDDTDILATIHRQ